MPEKKTAAQLPVTLIGPLTGMSQAGLGGYPLRGPELFHRLVHFSTINWFIVFAGYDQSFFDYGLLRGRLLVGTLRRSFSTDREASPTHVFYQLPR